MSNGTDRDEPGQSSADGSPISAPVDGSRPSSDPVWPVWGGAGTSEPETSADDETAPEPDETAPDETASDETASDDTATVSDDETTTASVPDDEIESEAAATEPDDATTGLDHPASELDGEASVQEAGPTQPEDAAVETDAAATAPGDAAAESDDDAAAPDEPEGASKADDLPAEPGSEGALADPEAGAETDAEPVVTDEAGPAGAPVDQDEAVVDQAVEAEPEAGPAEPEPEIVPVDADGAVESGDDGVGPGELASDEPTADPVTAGELAETSTEPSSETDSETRTEAVSAPDAEVDEDVAAVVEEPAQPAAAEGDPAPDADDVTEESVDPTPVAATAQPTADGDADPVVAAPAVEPDADEPDDAGGVVVPVAAEPDAPVNEVSDVDESRPDPDAPIDTDAALDEAAVPASSATPDASAAESSAAATAEPATTEPVTAESGAASAVTAAVASKPSGRDDATAVIAPVAAAAASTAAVAPPAAPPPVGTLTEAVTRTVPSLGPATTTQLPATAPAPAAAAAATAAASSAPAPTAPIPSGPIPPRAATDPAGPPPAAPIPSGTVPQSERDAHPLDVFEAEDGKRRWPKRVLIGAGVVVVLGGIYVGASYGLADRVPRGATVAGVDIGSLPSAEAVTRLDEDLADATTQPVEVIANDVQATIDPAAAGLTFDAQATVDQLTGVNLAEPQRLWAHLVGVGEQDPVTSVDDDALAAALSDLGTSLALAPVDGTVVFVDAAAQSTEAVDGWDLDQAGAADVLESGWLVAARPVELPTVTVEPDITQEETEAALAVAQTVTSAPVSVQVAGQTSTFDPPTLAANASFVPVDGALTLQMNGEGLSASVLAQLPDLLTQSADATFEFVNDAPTIIPGTPGTSLDADALAASVGAAAVAGDRTATVELVEADPSQSTAELEALGVKEIVAEFSTPLNSEPRRTVNITNGASKISGTLIRPEETFSLTEALGPIDAAHGYVEAGAIVSGEHTDAWGGGLSQISTTTYNAAFLAGFEDVEHRPHSEWFSRYPEGREATIFTGTLDMRWKNNTPYGALVQAWVSDGRVYVRVWGTKHWTVESITSPRSGVVSPTTVYSQSPACEPQSAGNPGFSVTVTRKTSLNGELVKTESNSWRYKPQNKVICGSPPAATPPAP